MMYPIQSILAFRIVIYNTVQLGHLKDLEAIRVLITKHMETGVPRFWHGFSFHHTNFLTCEMRVNILCIALNLGSVVLVEFLHACMHSTSSSCILSKCFLFNVQKFFHVHERHPRSVNSSGFGFYEEAFLIFRLLWYLWWIHRMERQLVSLWLF